MIFPVTTTPTELELSLYHTNSVWLLFNESIWLKKNSIPRVSAINVSISSFTAIVSGNSYIISVPDTSNIGVGDVGVLTDGSTKYSINVLGVKSTTELEIGTVADLQSITSPSINFLADSPYTSGTQESFTLNKKDKFFVVASVSTTIYSSSKKKIFNSVSSSGGGGVNCEFTNANPTPVTQGGITAGSTFNAVPCETMWERFLYPYQAPAFSSFYINGQSGTIEVGDTSLANPDFRWSTTNSGNVQANSIAIRDATAGSDMATGLANDGQETIAASGITNNSPATQTYTIRGTNTQSNSFNRNYNIYWRWRMYYGEDAATTLDEADIKALRDNLLTNTFARTYSLLGGATYKYIVYPASFGMATTFTDTGTGFAIAMEAPYTVPVTNSFGQTTNYNVHRTTNILNSAINIAVS